VACGRLRVRMVVLNTSSSVVDLPEVISEKSLQSKLPGDGDWVVILYNCDCHTFDDVIDSLMDVCGHGYLQSVQCAMITHNVGRCAVFTDSYDGCQTVHRRLIQHGLTVIIEKCEKNSLK